MPADNHYHYGEITHGFQFLHPDLAPIPTAYYYERSGVGLAFQQLRADPKPRRIAIVGLGIGTLAAYGQPGDFFQFYEINPK